ncbi:hypothetical protein Ngar_c28010 [Candidatus Nitrososphaera gargensis Ga9.2]|uniref:Uncharacterized protein n=1 Tax=Nitrososphaera gargensis (strain Ga9.2) TaxID=1237085 RepID=K0ILW1_NITGG|nr:hypothetical protein [Candidatus Nitrososphaera gargensis]AFU59722.1 hypothetical protein Ngar_c28010 [Candidatus Nitrososphaera gargensis Ga9.2]
MEELQASPVANLKKAVQQEFTRIVPSLEKARKGEIEAALSKVAAKLKIDNKVLDYRLSKDDQGALYITITICVTLEF